MKILLVTPPKNIAGSNVVKPAICTQPLGLAYLAAVLERERVSVRVLDGYSLGISAEQIQRETAEFRPDVIGISSYTVNIYDAYEVARLAKGVLPGAAVILGGPHATALPQEVAGDEHVDAAVVGEGETIIYDLCSQLTAKNSQLTVPNVYYKQDGQVKQNDTLPPCSNLDELPYPAHHLLPDINLYNPYPHWGKKGRFSSLITSRGCPYQCIFCSVSSAQGSKYRARSPQNILNEVRMLNKDFGVTTLSFRDGTIGTSRRSLVEMCEAFASSGMKVEWNCTIRSNEIDDVVARLMREAGCSSVQMGIEVGNPEMLKKVKRLTIEQVEKAAHALNRAGIRIHGYFMFGLPEETEATIKETVRFACRLPLHSAGFAIAIPYPGTEFFRYCEERNLLTTKQWDLYQTTRMVYRHENLSEGDIVKAQKRAFRYFYLRPGTILKMLQQISSFEEMRKYMYLGWNVLLR